ncbi:MAG: T9SS type A sorting domain-containing protein [Crocinitomicaceae bacterium]|nr:T9SS type A sorting domain-containing protein [Crocinitomicaceae bacterium]
MKKLLISGVFASAFFATSLAQEQTTENIEQPKSEKVVCTGMIKTPALRDMMPYLKVADNYVDPDWKPKDRDKKGFADPSTITEKTDADPIVQKEQGWRDGSNMVKVNFDGIGGGYPPDPTGAAGLEHFVQAKNSNYKVYNKDGSSASSTFSLSALWPGETDGDPIVMYDHYADRWFISQFKVDQSGSQDGILIAISETSDPTGAYYAYNFSVPMNSWAFPDYPKFGVWSNGYYMSANAASDNCIVFEKEKMLMGDAGASMIKMTFPSSIKYFFRSFAPSYAEGIWSPGADDPFYYFHVQDDAWSGVSYDHIKVIKCTVDWNAGTGNVSVQQEIPIASINTSFTTSWDDISQPGTSQKLDAVAGIFMYRVQYIKRPDFNAALMCTTVDVNGNNSVAGIRWFELRQDNADPSGDWYLYQEGTYSPDNTSRFMGSMAMDINGHIGMAYLVSSSSTSLGIRYTGRYANDALGEMTITEQTAVDGNSYQNAANRCGDYSQMSLDPGNNAIFWFTGEYMNALNQPRVRIFSFSMWELEGQGSESGTYPNVGIEEQVLPSYFNAYQPDPSTLKVTWNNIKDDQFDIQLIDMTGKVIKVERVAKADEQKSFEIPSFAKGIYLVRLVGNNTDLSDKVYLN